MDVAITGASGLIGQPLVQALTASGHTVRRVVRAADGGPGTVHWDPAAGVIDAHALDGVDVVVHLAGEGIAEKKWSPEQKARILDSRVQGTELLAKTLANLATPPAALVSGSAIGYYGDRGDESLDEASGAGSGFLADVCTAWEASTQLAADAGIRVAFARTGIVLASHGGALGTMLLPFKLGLGGRIGSGEQWMSWISLTDEVRALQYLVEHDVHGAANLTAPNPVRNRDFTTTLGHVLSRPTILPTPLFPLKIRFGAELVQHLLLDSARLAPKTLTASGFEFTHTDLESALRAELNRPA